MQGGGPMAAGVVAGLAGLQHRQMVGHAITAAVGIPSQPPPSILGHHMELAIGRRPSRGTATRCSTSSVAYPSPPMTSLSLRHRRASDIFLAIPASWIRAMWVFFWETKFVSHKKNLVVTIQIIQGPSWMKRKLQTSPCKLPVFIVAGGRSSNLEADLLPGSGKKVFDAVLSSTSTWICLKNAEWLGQNSSPSTEESDASAKNPHPPDDASPRRGSKSPEEVVYETQPDFPTS